MRVTKWAAALVCGMALTLPVVAQEDVPPKEPEQEPSAPPVEASETTEATPPPKQANFGDPPLHRWGGMTVSIAGWEPGLIGADEEIATTYSNGNGLPMMEGGSPHIRETVGALYHLPKDRGSIGLTYDSMNHSDSVAYLTPGVFLFGETRGFPFALGAFDDALADGVTAELARKTREFRVFYSQTAFETPRAKGTWSVGYRQLSHSRDIDISYLAVVPNLPPLIPPAVEGENPNFDRLTPIPDHVVQTASFDGHGIGASFDLEFPLHPRVSIVSGLSIGLIRGSASSAYSSQSSYYFLSPSSETALSRDELFAILNSADPQLILRVNQAVVFTGIQQPRTSQFAESVDLYLGLEAKVYKGLKIYGTVRDVYYINVGEYVVPKADGSHERTSLSVGYEGYALGLSWRF